MEETLACSHQTLKETFHFEGSWLQSSLLLSLKMDLHSYIGRGWTWTKIDKYSLGNKSLLITFITLQTVQLLLMVLNIFFPHCQLSFLLSWLFSYQNVNTFSVCRVEFVNKTKLNLIEWLRIFKTRSGLLLMQTSKLSCCKEKEVIKPIWTWMIKVERMTRMFSKMDELPSKAKQTKQSWTDKQKCHFCKYRLTRRS